MEYNPRETISRLYIREKILIWDLIESKFGIKLETSEKSSLLDFLREAQPRPNLPEIESVLIMFLEKRGYSSVQAGEEISRNREWEREHAKQWEAYGIARVRYLETNQ